MYELCVYKTAFIFSFCIHIFLVHFSVAHNLFEFFRVFGFVARKQGGASDNSCHLFAELDPDQPASAIVNFVTKVMIGQSKIKS